MAYPYALPAPPAPPDPPERPEGVSPWPRWRWWFGPVVLVLTYLGVGVVAVPIGLALGLDEETESTAETVATIVLTVFQDAALVGGAFLMAKRVAAPRLWHFGLTRTRFWPALGWSALALVAYYVVAATLVALLDLDEEQTTLDDLGADDSVLGLIVVGVLVIVLAPIIEEVFFRGFFYRALRTRRGPLTAALVVGGVFGLIHAPTGLEAVPGLVAFGIIQCLLYERTGSLYPCIALHALNNSLAFGFGAENAVVAVSMGAAMLTACLVAPRFVGRGAPALR